MQGWLSVCGELWLLGAALLWMVLGGVLFGSTDHTYKILYGAVLGFLVGMFVERNTLWPCRVSDEEP